MNALGIVADTPHPPTGGEEYERIARPDVRRETPELVNSG